MNAVMQRFETILTMEYDINNYLELTREIFPQMKIIAPNRERPEFSNFSNHIKGYTHVGNYKSPEGETIIIMAVQLQNARYVEGARSTQRSYAKKLIESANADAAFIAFYTEGDSKWRLSLVRLDYEMKIENGKLKTAENITPAKRYSYLVGKDEPSHTAISRFGRFIRDGILQVNPTLEELEEAFSVEKVTNEFFDLYSEKFHQLRESLEANEDFCIEAEQHNFTSAQFAKKLMGQIVFLYFLQKKGWLGVGAWPSKLSEKEYNKAFYARGSKSRELIPKVYLLGQDGDYHVSARGLESISDTDEEILASCVKGRPWGTGPKNFMRKLFDLAVKRNQNFFDDVLEPLFYNALNVNRGEQGYCPPLHCRIPFLSGGLFEPIDGYDWEHNNFDIPNEVFSNMQDKGKLNADGILDVFDRYNFTMSEDEPMEREVAIDPEMLGKVFENLLEINDRKSKGAFYTPREIVHYMCQESLINYLTRTMQIDEESIRDFILYGDFMKDEDTVKEKRQGNGSMYISEEIYKIDEKGNVTKNRLKELDDALKNVRVADPAVGSGAFPLGMLNEIVRARQNISAYMAITMNANETRMMYLLERSPHQLKYETIKDCIFAADLEPSAVDIAKLRLWLALVIDDEINPEAQTWLDGHRNPSPLPNLECNIICGNSLVDVFAGNKLIPQSDILRTNKAGEDYSWNQNQLDSLIPRLIDAQDRMFKCEDPIKKWTIREEIDALKDQMMYASLSAFTSDVLGKFEDSKQQASKPYVLWQIEFAKVFQEKGGFDIVIGNPPYIQLQKEINEETGEKLGDQYKALNYECFARTGDIYCLFYEKGFELLHESGVLSFITSNKWMRAGYGKAMRGFLAEHTNPLILIDFAGQKIFESATVDVNILMYGKEENTHNTVACIAKEECRNNLSVFVMQNSSRMKFETSDSWTILSPIEQQIRRKIEQAGIPLKEWNVNIYRGILTGFNEAFIISSEKKNELIAADPKSAEIIRPILRGRDIKRYNYSFADLWLIATFPSKKYCIDDYPAVRDYLLSIGKERLEQTGKTHIINGTPVKARKKTNNKWFETQDSISYWNDFSKPKIIWGNLCLASQFAYTEEEYFINAPSPMIVPGSKYLVAILNSKVADWYIRQLGVTRNGGYFEYKPMFVEKLPVPRVTPEIETEISELVDGIIAGKKTNSEVKQLEDKIDTIVNGIYGISEDEFTYICSKSN